MTDRIAVRALLGAALGTVALLAADPPPAPPPSAPPAAAHPWVDRPAMSFVNPELPAWLTFSGEFRYRFEDRRGLGFRPGSNDAYGLVRTRLDIAVKPKPWLKLFVQAQDARAPGMRHPNGVFRDPLDLRQAYVKLGGGESAPLGVTVGRQLLNYGDQRLIGPLDWTNTSRTFDAAKLEWRPAANAKFDLFSSSVVRNDPDRRLNVSEPGARLHGLYGEVKHVAPRSTLEPFLLVQTSTATVSELGLRGRLDRYTGGFRLWSKSLDAWDYNVSLIGQWGQAAGAPIRAWGAYGEVGRTFAGAPWKPRPYAEYTFGSGDSDPTDGRVGGFVDLYPTAHLWYGYNDMVGWRNLKNFRAGLDLKPNPKLGVKLDYHAFWLANRRDGLYNVAGVRTVAAPASGAADTKIGDEFDATFNVPLTKLLTVGGGVGYLFPGPFLKVHSPGASNAFTFLYAMHRF